MIRWPIAVCMFMLAGCRDDGSNTRAVDSSAQSDAASQATQRTQPTRSWMLPNVVDVIDIAGSEAESDSVLWLLVNDSMPVVRVDLRTGHVERRGQRGRGPTDVFFPWNFASNGTADTSPLIFDVGGLKLISLPREGEASTQSVQPTIARTSITSDFRATFAGHPKKLLMMTDRWTWLEPGESAHSDRHLWPLRVLSGSVGRAGHDTLLWRDAPSELRDRPEFQGLIPVPMLARCHDDLAVVHLGEPDSLLWLDAAGRTVGATSSGLPRHVMTAAIRRAFLQPRLVRERRQSGGAPLDVGEMAALISSMDEQFRAMVPDSTPRVSGIACDARGDVVVTAFPLVADDQERATTQTLVVIARDGRSRQVTLPIDEQVMFKLPGGVLTISDESLVGARLSFFALAPPG